MKKQESTEKKVFSYLEKHHMIAPGDKVVLGVSGGADSVCLLFLLLEYAKTVPLTLAVVHVNHGIRPDAGADEAYVKELCDKYQLLFFPVEEDVRSLARREKCSEEDAGRRVRYEAFERVAQELGATKVAVAHNCDDNAETMLLHLFRGSGLGGLCGISPVRELRSEKDGEFCREDAGTSTQTTGLQLIRPILCLRRHEIEEYLNAREIHWNHDSTNDSDDYARNRIRHHIMPRAEIEVAPGAPLRMRKTAELLQETQDFLEQETDRALAECLCTERDLHITLRREKFLNLHPAMQKRAIFRLARKLSPTGKDISQIHVEDMLRTIGQEGNRSVNLPFGIVVRRQYDQVILERGVIPSKPLFLRPQTVEEEEPARDPETTLCITVDLLKEGIYDLGRAGKLEISRLFAEKPCELPKNQYTKWFDYDKINECPIIRTRRQGDYLTISDGTGGSSHKALKDYMITEKIPKEIRDSIPVLAIGSHVIWLVGYRISEEFKVSGNTKWILQAKLFIEEQAKEKTEEENGRAD